MPDITEILGTLREPDSQQMSADTDTVAADLLRGQRALARRRRRRIAATGLVVAAAVAVGTLGVIGHSGTTASGVLAQQTVRADLVAYTGSQPQGFKVATVPMGWQVASSNQSVFLVAPPGRDTHRAQFLDGIVVLLDGDSRFPAGSPITKVTIHGKEGQLGYPEGRDAKWLFFSEAKGRRVLVQVPVQLGLTNDQIVEFASGITVTHDAIATGG